MLYRALTGRLPFAGRSLDVLMEKQRSPTPRRPASWTRASRTTSNALCVDLLRRDPSDRPTGEEVLRRLGGHAATSSATGPVGRERALFVGRERQLAQLGETVRRRQPRADRRRVRPRPVGGGQEHAGAALPRRAGRARRGGRPGAAAATSRSRSPTRRSTRLIDALSRYLRRLHRLEAEGLLPRDVAALARVFPVLRRVEAVAEAPHRSAEIPDPQELRRRAFAALRELLARIGDRKPLVLAIDDLQWGDVDSAALLCELLRPPDPPLLLLLCAYRSEYATQSPCLRMLLDPEVSGLPAESRRRGRRRRARASASRASWRCN